MIFLKTKDWAIPYSSIDHIRVESYASDLHCKQQVNMETLKSVYRIRVKTLYGHEFIYKEFPTREEAQEALEKLTNEIHWISTDSCPTCSTAR